MKLENFEFTIDNKGMYIVKKGRRYVRLGGSEIKYLFEVLKKGKDELPESVQSAFGMPDLSPELKRQLAAKFEEWGFVGGVEEYPIEERRFHLSKIYLFSFNPSKVLNRIPRFLKALFSLPGIVCIFLVLFAKYFLISDRLESIAEAVLNYKPDFTDVLVILLGIVISFGIHEFAHAMSCSYYGGTIGRMGMLLYFLLPAFFCDVSDIYLIAKRKVSFCVGIAGVTSNLLVGNFCVLIYLLTGSSNPVWLYIWFSNVGITVYNLLPIVKLDGYWVLSSIANANNLMDKSTVLFITGILKREDIPKNIGFLKRLFFELYGFSVFLVRPAIWVSSGYELQKLLLFLGCPEKIAFLLFVAVIAVALFDEVMLLIKQVGIYRIDRIRILNMI